MKLPPPPEGLEWIDAVKARIHIVNAEHKAANSEVLEEDATSTVVFLYPNGEAHPHVVMEGKKGYFLPLPVSVEDLQSDELMEMWAKQWIITSRVYSQSLSDDANDDKEAANVYRVSEEEINQKIATIAEIFERIRPAGYGDRFTEEEEELRSKIVLKLLAVWPEAAVFLAKSDCFQIVVGAGDTIQHVAPGIKNDPDGVHIVNQRLCCLASDDTGTMLHELSHVIVGNIAEDVLGRIDESMVSVSSTPKETDLERLNEWKKIYNKMRMKMVDKGFPLGKDEELFELNKVERHVKRDYLPFDFEGGIRSVERLISQGTFVIEASDPHINHKNAGFKSLEAMVVFRVERGDHEKEVEIVFGDDDVDQQKFEQYLKSQEFADYKDFMICATIYHNIEMLENMITLPHESYDKNRQDAEDGDYSRVKNEWLAYAVKAVTDISDLSIPSGRAEVAKAMLKDNLYSMIEPRFAGATEAAEKK